MAIASTGPIQQSLSHIASFLIDYALAMAVVGLLTVAVVEAWKGLRLSHGRFHRDSLLRWLHNDDKRKRDKHYHDGVAAMARRDSAPEPSLAAFNAGRAFEQLLHLGTGMGSADAASTTRHDASQAHQRHGRYERSLSLALFELPIERLMGQIQDAADQALHNPLHHPDLFAFLTRSARTDDVAMWLREVDQLASHSQASEQLRKDTAERYTRLKQQVRRHLDSFQIVTTLRWREWNLRAMAVVGAAWMLAVQLLALAHMPDGSWTPVGDFLAQLSPLTMAKLLLVAVFGGALAPVVKDLIDSLRKGRSGV